MPTALQLERSSPFVSFLLARRPDGGFFLIRDILGRNRKIMPAELGHASSLEEAKTMLLTANYGLVLFEHEMGGAAATKLLAEFLQTGCTVPFIVLAELADEKAVADMTQAGAPGRC